MPAISPSGPSARLESDRGGVFVLDIRPPDDFEGWHVPGSEHIDIYEGLTEDTGVANAALSAFPGGSAIVPVCAAE